MILNNVLNNYLYQDKKYFKCNYVKIIKRINNQFFITLNKKYVFMTYLLRNVWPKIEC